MLTLQHHHRCCLVSLGLKENVITGNLIPAGTGMRQFDDMVVGSKEEFELLMANRDVLQFDEEE